MAAKSPVPRRHRAPIIPWLQSRSRFEPIIATRCGRRAERQVRPCGRPWRPTKLRRSLEVLVALGPIAPAFLDPLQAAIAAGGRIGVILVDAGVHALLARG